MSIIIKNYNQTVFNILEENLTDRVFFLIDRSISHRQRIYLENCLNFDQQFSARVYLHE